MTILRLVLLLLILLGLAVLTLQNLTPALPLVFLGWRFPALPLGYLFLGAIAAGVLTGLMLLALLRLTSYLTWRQFEIAGQSPSQTSSSEPFTDWNEPQSRSSSSTHSSTSTSRGGSSSVNESNQLRDDWSYEAPQKPRSGSQSGSSYSYSYRDSEKSGAGQRESVYDADFRVVRPPNQPPEDDFGFDDDDDNAANYR